MSRVEEPGICYCECHDTSVPYRARTVHNFACCQGKCPVCKQNYKDETHVDDCQVRFDKLVAEAEANT